MSNQEILTEVQKAIGAHGAWKMKLLTTINTGKKDLNCNNVRQDNLCAFGQWLYGPTITPETKAGKPYEVVKRLHGDFHRSASDVLRLVEQGKKEEARTLLDTEYTQRSDILIKALNKWKGELQS